MTRSLVAEWPALLTGLALMMLLPGTVGVAMAEGAAEAPRVTAEEVKKLAAKGEVVIIDTRSKDAYDAEHVEGALSVPVDQVAARLAEMPKDKWIAAYCT